MNVLRAFAFTVLLLLLMPLAEARAQPSPGQPLPQGMTQEQFDALVGAMTRSVLEHLKAEGAPAHGSATPRAPVEPVDEFDLFVQQAQEVIRAIPVLAATLGRLADVLGGDVPQGRTRGMFLLLLVAAVAGAFAGEAIVSLASGRLRRRLAAGAAPERGLRSLACVAGLAAIDALGVFVFWLVGRTAAAAWFSSTALPDRFAVAVLVALLLWRLYALLFRIILRPDLPSARLCALDDGRARRLYRFLSAFVLLVVALRIFGHTLVALQLPPLAIQAGRLLIAPVLLLGFLWFVLGAKEAARDWLRGLGRAAPVARFVGDHWVPVATAFFLAVIATLVYGAVSGRQGVPSAVLLTIGLVAALLVFETLLQAVVCRFDSQLPGLTPAGDREKLPDVVARCIRVAILIVVLVVLSEHWVVDVLGLVDVGAWDKLTRSARSAGIALFAAFVLWELVKYFTDSYMQRLSANALGGPGRAAGGSVASRLDTLMPLARVTMAILIATVAALVALSEIGVDITPLLAGLSVFGLAVSFGSQTLVRDIVSGIFYLADDAFRVGEHIDCGKATGIVEGFTLRSIRLRNASGQVHTIPFGELGQIANFSRDWAAASFDLRFARDTDLDRLREATRRIGEEIMEVPALRAELLEPLAMHGIAEVADNALVVRFKFKARPGAPGRIKDEAIHRMFRRFPDLGIGFAG